MDTKSKRSNDLAKTQLGMNESTARNSLNRQMLFHLAHKCGMGSCYRCGEKLDDIKSFSIEHKIPWLHSENPVDLYFDLDNITFSHISCNSKASRRPNPDDLPHGVTSKYTKQGCRCELCTKAVRDYQRLVRARKSQR